MHVNICQVHYLIPRNKNKKYTPCLIYRLLPPWITSAVLKKSRFVFFLLYALLNFFFSTIKLIALIQYFAFQF